MLFIRCRYEGDPIPRYKLLDKEEFPKWFVDSIGKMSKQCVDFYKEIDEFGNEWRVERCFSDVYVNVILKKVNQCQL